MQTTVNLHDLVSRGGRRSRRQRTPIGIITLWNKAAERMFGYTEAEALGHSLDIMIPERLRQRHWEGYQETMVDGRHALRHRGAAGAGHRQGRTLVPRSHSRWRCLHSADNKVVRHRRRHPGR